MQPRSSSSTVQPLSKSRVLAMAASAGGLDPSYAPTRLEPYPCPGRSRVGVSGGTGGASGLKGTGGAGTPPAGQGRSCLLLPLPGLNGPALGWCNPLVGKWTS